MRHQIILLFITILTLIPGIGITGEIEWVRYPDCLKLDKGAQVSHPAVVFAGNRYHLWYASNNRINYAKSTDGLVWKEYPSNPVLTDGQDGAWDGDSVSQPSVVYDGAMYRMWFTGYDRNRMCIGYATSTDGVVWYKHAGKPVLDPGTSGSFDDAGVSGATVLYDGTVYRMWFTGYDGSRMRIGYATSTDGVVWHKSADNPVLNLGASGNFDDEGVSSPSVLFDGTSYQMWFTGYDGDTMRVGYATSTDGVVWQKDAANPLLLLGVNSNWDSEGVSSPSVLYDGISYRMWYSGYDGSTLKIGYAIGARPSPVRLNSQVEWVKYPANLDLGTETSHPSVLFNGRKYHLWYAAANGINYAKSTDGVVWDEYPSNPVLTDGQDGAWDGNFVSQPSVVYDGAVYRMWFTGYNGSRMRIGYATSTDGVEWHEHAGNPVLYPGTSGLFDSAGVSSPSVLYDRTVYRMWFTGYDGDRMRIGYATSTDGVIWNKSAGNPVLNPGASGNFDDKGVSSPSVLFDGTVYQMWFTGYDGDRMKIGYATSTDGVVWNKAEINPVLGLGTGGCWDDAGVSSPSILYDGRLYRLFYTGYDGSNTRLGYAIAQVPLSTPVTEPPPVANFSGTPTTGTRSLTVQFTDQSIGSITSWLWQFGDSGTSSEPSPAHTYTTTGSWTVILRVDGPGGSDTATRTEYITVSEPAPLAPTANFSGTPTAGTRPLTVQFTDQSTGSITTWFWQFGDGATATEQSLSHTYTTAGTYTVSLTVACPGGTDTATKTDYIVVMEDTVAPVTTDDAPLGWQNATVTVTLTVTDTLSGDSRTYYSLNGGTLTEGTTSVITAEGTNTLEYYSTDNAGNIEATRTATVRIDRTLPTTTDNAPTDWQNATVTVTIMVTDTLSGASRTYYSLNGDPFTAGTTMVITAEGTNTLDYYSTDNAGNIEAARTATVRIDRTLPDWTITVTPDPANAGTVTITIVSNEPLDGTPTVGVKDNSDGTITVTLESVENSTYIYSVVITDKTPDGTSTIFVAGTDTAGNQGTGSKAFHVSIPRKLEIVSGEPQAGMVNATLAPFVVKVTDTYGNPIAGHPVHWNIIESQSPAVLSATTTMTGADGTTETSLTLGTKSGTYRVTAHGSMQATFTATATPDVLEHINISPVEPSITVNQPFSFTADGYDQFNNEIAGLIYDWAIEGDIGSLTAAVGTSTSLMAASTPAIGTISAGTFNVTGKTKVSVVFGQLASVTITPAASIVEVLGSRSFTAQAFNQYGFPNSGATYTWTLKTVGMGMLDTTIGQTVVFAATKSGTVDLQVIAGFGTRTAMAIAKITVVNGAVHHINITPAMATIEARGTASFTARAYNQYDYELTEAANFDWQIVKGSGTVGGGPGRTVVIATNDVVGTLTLTASTNTVTGTSRVDVIHGSVSMVSITPATAMVEVMGSQTFMAGAVNHFGHPIPVSELSYGWWLSGIGGTITVMADSAVFTAGSMTGMAGITAEAGGYQATAAITITPGAIKQIVFTQTPGTLTTGMPGTMTIQMQDEYGNASPMTTDTTVIVCGDDRSRFAGASSGAAWTTSGTFTIAGTSSLAFWFKQNGMATSAVINAAIGTSISATHTIVIEALNSSSSGVIVADDGKTTVEVGTGAITGAGYIEIDTSGTSTANMVVAANMQDDTDTRIDRIEGTLRRFEIHDAAIIATTTARIRISIPYPDVNPDDGFVDGTRIREEGLKIYTAVGTGTDVRWQPVEDSWVDWVNNIVYADVPHFSYYILIGNVFQPNLEKALVYPNPFYAENHSCVYFDQLSQDATIQIFNIAGELVHEMKVQSSPQSWDIRNSAIASGIYIYLIKDPAGNRKVGKLGVIR